ncbi:MAG: hypothetical protein PHN69_03095 [Candidatus Pacebacteria bacterium]|nr:hypothetical protein [Candidatus Paceibacterota bacterium]
MCKNCLKLEIREMEVVLDALKECPVCKTNRQVPGYCPREQSEIYNKIKEVYLNCIDEKLKELDADKPESEPSSVAMEYGIGTLS